MAYYPIVIVLIFAVLDWVAVERNWKPVEYVAKPATMLAVLLWIWLSAGFGGGMLWFTVGVIFCLAGDVFLMLPPKLFILGLLAFLVGQLCYVVGFNTSAPYLNLWGVFLIIVLGIYMGWLYPRLAASLTEKGKNRLKIPVLIYATVISVMVYSALMTFSRPGWATVAALSASIGALLFYTSDSILAWDRFVNPLSHGRLRTMIFYHLGVIGIVLGAILHAVLK
jgi:alkenylglycerophosphocholine/alkenylglycerophosphoethanolamine hydrolase